jgi:hypothetical protein
MKTPDRRRSGTPPSAQNGLTGLYFGADLEGAQGQLADTRSLQGATMPNGQKYENWLKSKGRAEDAESE